MFTCSIGLHTKGETYYVLERDHPERTKSVPASAKLGNGTAKLNTNLDPRTGNSTGRLEFCLLPASFYIVPCVANSSVEKVEVTSSPSSSSIVHFQRTAPCYIPEHRAPRKHRCENFRSYTNIIRSALMLFFQLLLCLTVGL